MSRHRDVGMALTEMRTVLSRAKTARDNILDPTRREEIRFGMVNGVWSVIDPGHPDPDQDEMIAALDTFIAAAERWERRGRK